MRFDPTTSVVETHISRLRAKVDKPFDETLIRTVRGPVMLSTLPVNLNALRRLKK
ncbi:helix-turn-helix domain-containing protein [Aliamphritea spongicola]|nr:helix-turn-helix domain-containing protein [Aliamphritea spongicola]